MINNNKKVDFSERMKKLQETKQEKNMSGERREVPKDVYICPFMSDSNSEIACSPKCPMYRKSKPIAYACPFTELSNMAWNIKDSCDRSRKQ